MTAEEIARRCKGYRQNGSGWLACCPSHPDHNPSLSIATGTDGRVILKCFTGCSFEAIVQALSLDPSDLFPPREEVAGAEKPVKPTVAILAADRYISIDKLRSYGLEDCPSGVLVPYYDREEGVLFHKTRIKLHGPGHYVCDKGTHLRLYGLWRLDGSETLYVVEGESDCWVLWSQDIPAVGVPGSTNLKSLDEPGIWNGVREVFVIREADDAGKKFAAGVCEIAQEAGLEAYAVDLGAKDTSVLYMRGPSRFRAEFMAACERARSGKTGRTWAADELQSARFPPRQWIVEGLLLRGLALMAAPAKVGKTRLMTAISSSIAYGGLALERFQCAQGGVIYLDLEGDPLSAQERLGSVLRWERGGWPPRLHLRFDAPSMDGDFFGFVEKLMERQGDTAMVVVDTLDRIWPSKSPRKFGNARDMEAHVLRELHGFAQAKGISLFLIHHPAKTQSADAFNASGTGAMLSVPDVIWNITRKRLEDGGELIVSGRGIPERKVELIFDPKGGNWRVQGEVAEKEERAWSN